MVSDSSSPPLITEPAADAPTADAPAADAQRQVQFTSENGYVKMTLPREAAAVEASDPSIPWGDWLQQMRLRLDANERFWQANTEVHLHTQDRLLDVRQLQALADLLTDHQLHLKRVITSRRQTAMAAVTLGYSVDQMAAVNHLVQATQEPVQPLHNPLYLQTTVRSGVEIRHGGSIIILGDTNPGSFLLASGDILVWGRLRGMAHAGTDGNRNCRIMALQMQPTQLRIADLMARPPETPPAEYLPEVAYIGAGTIRIAVAQNFARQFLQPTGGLEVP